VDDCGGKLNLLLEEGEMDGADMDVLRVEGDGNEFGLAVWTGGFAGVIG
jgi:hypothetical protein